MSSREKLAPATTAELCDSLRSAASTKSTVEIGGAFSKGTMGGPLADVDFQLTSAGMNRVLAYEPKDLTISVEAGMQWAELERVLADNNQFIPVDPAFAASATVGGVVASDSSGPRRRRYGSVRDMTIGMSFATVEGKLVQSGGMVVKNVAGLDMAKLLIGSFGTLAVIATVNFKVLPKPVSARSFEFSSQDLAIVLKVRRNILSSQVQPVALDLLSTDGNYRLLAEAHGSEATVARYEKDYSSFASSASAEFTILSDEPEHSCWQDVREFSSRWMDEHPEGGILRVSVAASNIGDVVALCTGPSVSRAAIGVTYVGCEDSVALTEQLAVLRSNGLKTLVEHASPELKSSVEQWPASGAALTTMLRLKNELDPDGILSPKRLFGKI